MSEFCKDRDLQAVEPAIFLTSGFPCQELITGTDGVFSGTTFTSASSDFQAAGIVGGMVLCTYSTTPAEGSAFEIVSVDSATTLTVSVLRADPTADPVAPPAGSDLSFFIRTFAPQISGVSATLAEKMRLISEVSGIAQADFADSAQLARTCAYGTLASVFVARAENATPSDANWIKAEHYRNEFLRHQLQLRLVVDSDGDGQAEASRTLGNVTLRRV
ncbi:MAG: hypothetical protein ACYTF6_00040 [Planctomycetota bacterium]|jgi:hypothetical protein